MDKRYESFLELAPDATVLISEDGKIQYANEQTLSRFGYTRDELIGQPIALLLPNAPQLASPRAHHMRLMPRRMSLSALRKNGAEFPVEIALGRADCADPDLDICIIRDVSQQRRAHERFHFLSEAMAAISSSLDMSTALFNIANSVVPAFADWCVVYYVNENGEVQQTSSHIPSSVLASKIAELRNIYPTGGIYNPAVEVIRTGHEVVCPEVDDAFLASAAQDSHHLQLLKKLGLRSCIVSPIGLRPKTIGAISLLSVTPGRTYGQEDLELATQLARHAGLAIERCRLYTDSQNAIRMRDELLSIASHDLKNPLTSISLSTQLITERCRISKDDASTNRALASISHSINSMQALIREFLDIGQIEAGSVILNYQTHDLRDLATRTTEILLPVAREKSVKLQIDAPAGVSLNADPDRLHQILSNILGNAIKYSPYGGTVELSIQQQADDQVLFCVTDQGPGIAETDLKHVFDRFWQAEPVKSGSGLGLYIARKLVEAHGGHIWVKSKLGQGASFCFSLPRAARAVA